jgi:hypothetical protein
MTTTTAPATTVSLRKAHHEPLRFDCAAEDVWYALEGRPLWWDEASYIRYQSDTGDEPWRVYRLRRQPGSAPIERGWARYEWNEDTDEYELSIWFESDIAAANAALDAKAAEWSGWDEVPF